MSEAATTSVDTSTSAPAAATEPAAAPAAAEKPPELSATKPAPPTKQASLTDQQKRERIKAIAMGKDPDKVVPLKAEPPVKRPTKPKVAPPPPAPAPAAAATPPAATPAAPAAPATPAAPAAAKDGQPDPAAPASAADSADEGDLPKQRAELAKNRRALSRDLERHKAERGAFEKERTSYQEERRVFDEGKKAALSGEPIDVLDRWYKEQGKDLKAALQKWASAGRPQLGQPAAPAAAEPQRPREVPQPPGQPDPVQSELEELRRFKAEKAGEEVKQAYVKKYTDHLQKEPPSVETHPAIAELDDGYLAEVMFRTALTYFRETKKSTGTGIELDTAALYDMIEEAEQDLRKVEAARLKRKPAPEREPAGQSRAHEPSPAKTDASLRRARPGSLVREPTGGYDRAKLKEILHKGTR